MDLQNIIIFSISLLTIFLGILVLIKNHKNPSNIWYFLMCLSGGVWGVTKFFQFSVINEYYHNFFINKLAYVFGILAALSYLILSYFFPYKNKKYSKKIFISIYIIPIVLISLIVSGVLKMQDSFIIERLLYGEVIFLDFLIFPVYFFIYVFAGFLILLKKYFLVDTTNKIQIKYLLLATMGNFITVGTVSIILVLFNIFDYDWLGPIFLSINFLVAGYLIFIKPRMVTKV